MKNLRPIKENTYQDGQRIVIAWYETEDGVDEKCMIIYINDKLDNVVTEL